MVPQPVAPKPDTAGKQELPSVGKPVEQPADTLSVEFRVQIAASGNDLELKAYNFKGLSALSRYYDPANRLYKYYYSRSATFDGIQSALKEAKDAGYTAAFVVAFRNGEPISLQEAMDKQKNN